MIQEVTFEQVMKQRFNRQPTIVFFYTPLCGTCKLAKQMLDVAHATLSGTDSVTIMVCNLNQMPSIAKEWEITSVPCLTFLNHGKIMEKVYSFQSVDNIYHKILDFNRITQKNSG